MRFANFVRAGLVTIVFLSSCGRSHEGQGRGVESLLFGGESCKKDLDCFSRRCNLGICLGFLMNSVEGARVLQLQVLGEAAREPGFSEMMLAHLVPIALDKETDPFIRARAIQALSVLPGDKVVPLLLGLIEEPDEPVRFSAARSLYRFGHREGKEALEGFLDHPSEAVRALARFALSQ